MGELEPHFSEIARESVEVFDEIARKAREKITSAAPSAAESMATVNTFTDSGAVPALQQIQNSEVEGLRALVERPAIARVLAKEEDGTERVFFISGRSSISLDHSRVHASYRSAIGRLASLPPGEELVIERDGKDRVLEVLEIARYRPSREAQGWESRPVFFEGFEFEVQSYPSLRSLLRKQGTDDAEAVLEALLGGSGTPERIGGLRHEVRSAMALREQPILDRFQDEIFRLPLDSELMILGPPGTGKTTTLIKRLGQKLDREFLSGDEERIAARVDAARLPYGRSWMMFTPTDLLKHYVREAFNREQVPASEAHIRTWSSLRIDLARQVLGILQSGTTKGKFVLKEEMDVLNPEAKENAISWYEDLLSFHHERILEQLRAGVQALSEVGGDEHAPLVERISEVVEGARPASLARIFESLDALEDRLTPVVKELKADSDELIRRHLVQTFNRDRSFLDDLAGFLDSLQGDDVDQSDEDEFDEDEADQVSEQTSAQKANTVYAATLRSVARYRYQKRSVPRNSRAAAVSEWLGDRMLGDDVLVEIGERSVLQNAMRRFVNPHKRFVMDVPASYRAFRRKRARAGRWYSELPVNARHLSARELDGIVLSMLQGSRELLGVRRLANRVDEPAFQYLKSIADRHRAQILVDEATDFSPIQLAAMRSLTSPVSQSFFACGDFNQRITSWGTASREQLEWAIPGLETRAISTVYRQSRRLNRFSRGLLDAFGGDTSIAGQLPEHVIHEGVGPALIEDLSDPEDQAMWLYERIQEVERIVGPQQVPSIAVLVNQEDRVGPMAEALNLMLEDINLQAIACHDGQVLGEHSQIRVFDIAHIKGLEFEAVFFVGIDELERMVPELFGKYLYVGATRAATYFGAVCESGLPADLESLRDEFVDAWSS